MSGRNIILALKVGEVWIEGASKITQEGVNYFTKIFRELFVDKPHLDVVVPSLLETYFSF